MKILSGSLTFPNHFQMQALNFSLLEDTANLQEIQYEVQLFFCCTEKVFTLCIFIGMKSC